jgi:TRAP-type C4-dicarboxylate transport system permease small subunit
VPPSDDPNPPAEATPAAPAEPAPAVDPHADDGPVSGLLRKIDGYLGLGEQALVVALLALVVITSITNEMGGNWGDDGTTVIKYSVFAIAMLAGAFAAQQRRLLSLDLVSRFLKPRPRAVLRVVLALFAIFIAAVAVWGGLEIYDAVKGETKGFIPIKIPALFIPIGFVLIGVHLAIQVAIEVDYLRRGKTAPEPEQGAV